MSGLSLDKILNDLNAVTNTTNQEKTASAASKTSDKTAKAGDDLKAVLKKAEETLQTAKTASTATPQPVATLPVQDLTKMASDLASAGGEALIKEAQLYGASIADGFMTRLKQYEDLASQMETKTASETVDVEKIATEAVRGYIETKEKLEKNASESYQQGYNETVQQLEKVAEDCFNKGVSDCANVLASVQA